MRRVGAAAHRPEGELAEIIVREMGKPIAQAIIEVEFAAAIFQYYADRGPGCLADEPIDVESRLRRGPQGGPSASCSGSCRGTSPTTRWRASPDRTCASATRCCSSTHRSVPSRLRRRRDLRRRRRPRRRLRQHLRHQRAGRRHHRRPPGAGVSADRLRARRLRGRRDRRPQPQEGRAGAGRLRPVHPSLHRRPRRRCPSEVCARDGQQRAVLQCGQALHRRRRPLRRVRREIHRRSQCGRPADLHRRAPRWVRCRPTSRRSGCRSSSTARWGRGRRAGARRAAGQLLPARRPRRHHPGDEDAYRQEFFGPVAMLFRARTRTTPSAWPTTPRSASVPTSTRPTPTRPTASPTGSTPAWCG